MSKKKILLTGATGFLGSHLLSCFLDSGFEVDIIKRTISNTSRVDALKSRFNSFNNDELSVAQIVEKSAPDIIIHTACIYGRGKVEMSEILKSNLLFGIELLVASVKFGVKTFINTDTLLPKFSSAYSQSKSQFNEWFGHFNNDIQIINIKLEHLYGPMDDNQKFIQWILEKMLYTNEKLDLSSGRQLRDFIYISDAVNLFLLTIKILHKLPNYFELNVLTGRLISIKDIVLKLAAIVEQKTGRDVMNRLNFGVKPDSVSLDYGSVDTSNLEFLNWKPIHDLDKGLKLLLENEINKNIK